ncbi:MAG: acyltransferase [Rhodoferax sp.]|nr:acyltransferase [Rhodoferax sp.]
MKDHLQTRVAAHVNALDGLRGFAVLVVLLMHTLGIPRGGELGVDIFFALSGYLISSQLLSEITRSGSVGLVRFYWKRCIRLIPAFLAVCVLYSAMRFCFPANTPHINLLTMLTLPWVANISWANGAQPAPFLQHTWSLAVEWQFYLVWPLVLIGLFKVNIRRNGLLMILVLSVLAVWVARWRGDQLLRFEGILIGSMIPLIKDRDIVRRIIGAKHSAWLIFLPAMAMMAWLILQPVQAFQSPAKPVTSLLSSVIMLYLTVNSAVLPKLLLGNGLLRHFGTISYGLYLFHFPIAALMYVNGFSPWQMLVVGVLVAVPLAEVSWRYLESPILQRWSNRTAVPTVPAPLAERT